MPDKNQRAKVERNHLDEDDLERAEKGMAEEAPLAANEEDAFVPDTELTNPDPEAKVSAIKNDPTAGDAADH